MKQLIVIAALFATITASSQTINATVDFGAIDKVSVGITTWKWLYTGLYFQQHGYIFGNSQTYKFYTPGIFLRPTVNIGTHLKVSASGYYGLFTDNLIAVHAPCMGTSIGLYVKVYKRLYADCELGYMHVTTHPTRLDPIIETDKRYFAVGISYFRK